MNPLVGDDGLPLMTADGLAAVAECPDCCAPVTYVGALVCGSYSGPPVFIDVNATRYPGVGVCAGKVQSVGGVSRCVIGTGVAATPAPGAIILQAQTDSPWVVGTDCCGCQPGCAATNVSDIAYTNCVSQAWSARCCYPITLSRPLTVAYAGEYVRRFRSIVGGVTPGVSGFSETLTRTHSIGSPTLVDGAWVIVETVVERYVGNNSGTPDYTQTRTFSWPIDGSVPTRPGQNKFNPPRGYRGHLFPEFVGCTNSLDEYPNGSVIIYRKETSARFEHLSCTQRVITNNRTTTVRSTAGRNNSYPEGTLLDETVETWTFATSSSYDGQDVPAGCRGGCASPPTVAVNPEDLL